MKKDIVILGVGHSGTTILSKMINRLGWALNDADEKYAESISVRCLNELLCRGEYVSSERMDNCLSQMKRPWVIKDPRFCETLNFWAKSFENYEPLLIWITRDRESLELSYARRKEGLIIRGMTREQNLKNAAVNFQKWPWAKTKISLENLTNAVKLFDTIRP